MKETHRNKSLFLSFLMLTSVMIGMVGMIPTAVATNETSNGTVTGTEVWSGTHTLTGDVIVATGANLIVQPGTTVTIPNGTFIDVRGGLCAGDVACGANGMASNSSRITFNWQDPANASATGNCYGIFSGNHWNRDPSCHEGILLRSTVDIGATKLKFVSITNAYGIPRWVSEISEVRYGAIVAEGASPTMTELKFEGINTTSLLILDLARPDIVGGEFTVGDDATSLIGSAIQAYGAGSPIQPLSILSPVFTGTDKGCGQSDDGRHVLWVEESYVDIQYAVITNGDYGIRLDDSAGHVNSSTIDTTCNGIDVNNKKTAGNNAAYKLSVNNNKITTADRSPLTAFNFAWVDFNNNVIDGAGEGSGVQISKSQVNINGGTIGPIGGWNGIWSIGESDVRIENVTIEGTAKEPIVAGEYHFGDSGWTVPSPSENRMYVANSIIDSNGGECTSLKAWGGDFPCPAVHAFRSSLTLLNNDINIGGEGDGIRAIGALLDIRNNVINSTGTGAMIKHHNTNYAGDSQYGTLGFFSGNTWSGVGQTYNVTKSSITVQSENIPIPNQGANTTNPVTLSWPDVEAAEWTNWDGQVLVPTCSVWPPQNFPLTMDMTNNSTVFTYSNLTGLDTSNIYIDTSPIKWAVQIRKAEIVKFRTIVEGVRVGGSTVLIEDSHGTDLYSLTTDSQGWTPEVSLASDFHLDMTGGGPGGIHPDRYADDDGENSCSDGMDNDGDLIYDGDDPDCQAGSSSREMSLYYVSAYKFGKGYKKYSLTMTSQTGVLSEIVSLENLEPSITVSQNDGHSFKRSVNFTGTAHDGTWAGIYASDELARWDQQGAVEQVQVKDPFTSDWIDMRLAVDNSNSDGEVTYNNHPFSHWYFEYDMSDQPEGDYTFEFRSFDGVTESQIVTRTVKLNTEPPTIWVDGPASGTVIDDGIVHFIGRASDAYSGIFGSDIQRIWFEVDGPINANGEPYYNKFDKPGGTAWSADWTVGHLLSGTYTVNVWASDSAFCTNSADECTPVELILEVDNDNAIPVVQLLTPFDLQTITASEDTLLSGVARDTDGTVTKVEIVIKDPQAGFLEMPEGPHSLVQNIAANGGWATSWDTTNLVHNYHYIIEVRSFDGFQYSEAASIEIIIDNPPNQDNTRPAFNSTSWPDSATIFCEETGASQNRCGNGYFIDLTQFFSDVDEGDSLSYYVYDNPEMFEDDYHAEVVLISGDGIANYNPMSMSFYEPDMADWSLEAVIFEVRDNADSRVYSASLDLDVVGVSFTSECDGIMVGGEEFVEGCDGQISQSDTLIYRGNGRPTVSVIGETGAGLRLGSTAVGDDGMWMMEIPGNRLDKGSNTVVFEYGSIGQPLNEDSEIVVEGGLDEGSGIFMWILMVVAALVVLGVLGAVFVFFFVEFEDDYDEDLDEASAEEVDPYAWAKERQQQDAAAEVEQVAQPAVQQEATPAVSGYPGWKWDAEQNKWIPDNE
ncbi:MAG: Ig-like domain-containing protein [Candidatus Thalassarchaeaceae archaeon]|nr:Ig-like domain-containing protein [Candidatus Thalassarchaeaceae archaeon]